MPPPVRKVDIFRGTKFSPKQAECIEWFREQRLRRQRGLRYENFLVLPWGRRCGKSHGMSALYSEMLCKLLEDTASKIRRNELAPWAGIGKTRTQQKRRKPHHLCFVVAPSTRDLRDIAGHILNNFDRADGAYIHPDVKMQITDNGGSMWFLHEGACARIDFIPARTAGAMVGRGVSLCLITESEFIESGHWEKLEPSFWDERPWVVTEGTPRQDYAHWYTRHLVSGLPDGHPEADRKIAERKIEVRTIRANTIDHAFFRHVREAAKIEKAYKGERWAKKWIEASYELPTDAVFDEYDPTKAVVSFLEWPLPIVNGKRLPRPWLVETYVDFHQGSRPGAAVTLYIWPKGENPLDRDDPRPLFLVVSEFQDDEVRYAYTNGDKGWWTVLDSMSKNHGANSLWCDPTAPALRKAARRDAGLHLKAADNTDKDGRIQLVNAQCRVGPGGYPALLIADTCPKTAKCLQTVQWKKDKEGRPTDTMSEYNDHLADCLAYAAGRHARGGFEVSSTLS